MKNLGEILANIIKAVIVIAFVIPGFLALIGIPVGSIALWLYMFYWLDIMYHPLWPLWLILSFFIAGTIFIIVWRSFFWIIDPNRRTFKKDVFGEDDTAPSKDEAFHEAWDETGI